MKLIDTIRRISGTLQDVWSNRPLPPNIAARVVELKDANANDGDEINNLINQLKENCSLWMKERFVHLHDDGITEKDIFAAHEQLIVDGPLYIRDRIDVLEACWARNNDELMHYEFYWDSINLRREYTGMVSPSVYDRVGDDNK